MDNIQNTDQVCHVYSLLECPGLIPNITTYSKTNISKSLSENPLITADSREYCHVLFMKHTKQNGKYPTHDGLPLNQHKQYQKTWRFTNLVNLTVQSEANSIQ
jgi:hypothetical protein